MASSVFDGSRFNAPDSRNPACNAAERTVWACAREAVRTWRICDGQNLDILLLSEKGREIDHGLKFEMNESDIACPGCIFFPQ